MSLVNLVVNVNYLNVDFMTLKFIIILSNNKYYFTLQYFLICSFIPSYLLKMSSKRVLNRFKSPAVFLCFLLPYKL